jgi:hypothetical protein
MPPWTVATTLGSNCECKLINTDHFLESLYISDDKCLLIATIQHPKLGKILFFDPTDYLTQFGQIRGALQANYGLLVTSDGGELIELPQQPSSMNSVQRTATMTLDTTGTLKGDVKEVRLGEARILGAVAIAHRNQGHRPRQAD